MAEALVLSVRGFSVTIFGPAGLRARVIALRDPTSPRALVLRDGVWQRTRARLVVGDTLLLVRATIAATRCRCAR
jgi:hypothetical protein